MNGAPALGTRIPTYLNACTSTVDFQNEIALSIRRQFPRDEFNVWLFC